MPKVSQCTHGAGLALETTSLDSRGRTRGAQFSRATPCAQNLMGRTLTLTHPNGGAGCSGQCQNGVQIEIIVADYAAPTSCSRILVRSDFRSSQNEQLSEVWTRPCERRLLVLYAAIDDRIKASGVARLPQPYKIYFNCHFSDVESGKRSHLIRPTQEGE